jgi:hypothetical protein
MKISEYIRSMINDPWIDTDIEGYKFIGNVQKGAVGEVYVSNYMKDKLGSEVLPADCGTNGPYDRIIDGINTEIKFSAAHSDNDEYRKTGVPSIKRKKKSGEVDWTINHVAVGKCWERLIFCGMDLVDGVAVPNLVWCTKQDFIDCLDETTFFNHGQGGNKGTDDDFMCSAKIHKWMKSDYTKDIAEWN